MLTTLSDDNCIVNTNSEAQLRVKLRQAMDRHQRQTGERLTYDSLSKRTGLSRATLESLASRPSYNTRLSTIEKLCRVLDCQPGDLLELIPESEAAHED